MKRSVLTSSLLLAPALLAACENNAADTPPSIRLGDSVCDQCNMIISDERWATATIIDGDRGPEPRLFDDFNCQVHYELEHPESVIVGRWSHDHQTHGWIRTEDAHFVLSPNLRAPMGSGIAAFSTVAEAESAKATFGGELMTFGAAWAHLGPPEACCEADSSDRGADEGEKHHEP